MINETDKTPERREKLALDALNALGIKYAYFQHAPAKTMDDCKGLDDALGLPVHCKNLFLTNRQKTEFFLLLIGADKRFVTANISKQIGKSRLSFGDDELLLERLNLLPGAVGPLSLIFDTDNAVTLLVDEDLRSGRMCFHPNVNTASVAMDSADFYGVFLPSVRHEPLFVHID